MDEHQRLVDACCRLLRALDANAWRGGPMVHMPDAINAIAEVVEGGGEPTRAAMLGAVRKTTGEASPELKDVLAFIRREAAAWEPDERLTGINRERVEARWRALEDIAAMIERGDHVGRAQST